MTASRLALAAALLSVAGCDASDSGSGLRSLVGTYTLTVNGAGPAEGRAFGTLTDPAVSTGFPETVSAAAAADLAEGVEFSFDVRALGIEPRVYRVARTEVDGCGDARSGSEDGLDAFVFVYLYTASDACAAAVVDGEVEVLAATEADTRLRFAFTAVQSGVGGVPDTLRAAGTFRLALDPDRPDVPSGRPARLGPAATR